MRTSYWVIGEKIKIGKRSKRLLVEVDGSVKEVAVRKVYLLAIKGEGWITSEAAFLAYREGVHIVLVGDKPIWLEVRKPRYVDYLLSQYNPQRWAEIADIIWNSYARRARRVLGVEPPHYDPLEERLLEKAGGLRAMIREKVGERLGCSESWVLEYEGLARGFLCAECIAMLYEAGLNPLVGLVEDEELYEEFSLEFECHLVWEPLTSLEGSPLVGADLTSVRVMRAVLTHSKNRLDGYTRCGRTLREVMWRRARSLASVLVNPSAKYEVV